MPIKTPLTYLLQRREQAHVRKPTTHAKVASYNYINPQISSSFFSRLPGEIRNRIYEFALTASPNRSQPFSKHSWHYRPGFTYARFINTNLLLACRRVYLEADHLAISLNEHLIFQPAERGPPGHSPYLLPPAWSRSSASSSSSGSRQRGRLKHAQRENIRRVHLFAQQHWLEDWTRHWHDYCYSWSVKDYGIGPGGNEHPERLKITLRHTDWWYFLLGENSPLALDPKFEGRAPPRSWIANDAPFMPNSWGSRFRMLNGLKVFELELETLEQKKNELDEIIERAYGWELPLQDDQVLVCDRDATHRTGWTGSKHFTGLNANRPDPTARRILLQGKGMSSSSSSTAASQLTASRSNSIEPLTRKNQQQRAKKSWSQSSFKKLTSSRNAEEGEEAMAAEGEGEGEGQEEEQLAPEDQLKYYVVTLTFRAQDSAANANANGYKIEKRIDRNGHVNEGETQETAGSAAATATPTTPTTTIPLFNNNAPVLAPNPQQGIFAPAPWVPRRSGFPTAYG